MDMPITIHRIEQCTPSAPAAIVEAIIRTESGFNPIAINVNRGFKLARQPRSLKEAKAWARWLLANGHSFDCGLMQINSSNWRKLGLTAENVFDVCENIRAGAKLFSENFNRAAVVFGPGRTSLVSALSAYNTGDFKSGVHTGYASKLLQNVLIGESDIQGIPPLFPAGKTRRSSANHKDKKGTNAERNTGGLYPPTVPTTVDGFYTEDSKAWGVEPKPESTHGFREPGILDPPAPKSSSWWYRWWKEFSDKAKCRMTIALLAASLLTA